jgi:hypothetical protein
MNDFIAIDFETVNHADHMVSQVKIQPKGEKDA